MSLKELKEYYISLKLIIVYFNLSYFHYIIFHYIFYIIIDLKTIYYDNMNFTYK